MAVKPPDQTWESGQEWLRDQNAAKEAKNIARLGELEDAKHAVKVNVHFVLSYLVPATVVIAFILFWLGVIIYAWHIFGFCPWLSEVQLNYLKTIIFSGVIGAVVSQGVKRYLD